MREAIGRALGALRLAGLRKAAALLTEAANQAAAKARELPAPAANPRFEQHAPGANQPPDRPAPAAARPAESPAPAATQPAEPPAPAATKPPEQPAPALPPEAHRPCSSTNVLLRGTQLDPDADPCALIFSELDGLPAYERYLAAMEPVYRKRRYLELALAAQQQDFTYRGHNALLGLDVDFAIDYRYSSETVDDLKLPNYRERVVCSESGLNSRLRGILLVLRRFGGEDIFRKAIYATERLTPFHEFLKQRSPGLVGSEYLGPAVPRGAMKGDVRNEDITALTFADQTFDAIVTNDVLEHVPDYRRACSELYRTLAPGGQLFITVPFSPNRYHHLIRARMGETGEIEHIEPPEYHGDPVNPDGGILCFQTFGWRLLDELKDVGFKRATAVCYWSLHHGLLGGELMAFCAWK